MPGEKIVERPAGAAESDFDTLNDWTITDIANTEKAAPEDRQNAKAEIARRESEGTYDPDSAPRDVRHDLLSNGYGVEDGKVLYPKPEYKAWLQSDRSEPMPTGIDKETIQDRLDAEKVGAAALDAYAEYENELPMREKISHPERTLSENKKLSMERRVEEKARDLELDERRKLKEINKYDNSYSNPIKEAASQARANLPIVEEQPVASERIREAESLDSKAEKMYNVYSEHFSENAPKWLAYGISSAIEKGTFNSLPTSSLVASGFWSREQDKIHDKLDPEDTMSTESSDAEHSLKVHVARDLIGEKSGDLSEKEIERARLKGSLYAVSSGARIDERSRKVVYAIPPEKGGEIRDFMEQAGLNFDQFGESASARALSYQGFANIIEAIKGDKKETERGFKALDWYFDNFKYSEKTALEPFLGALGSYAEAADDRWKAKYEEYCDYREEIRAFYERQKKVVPTFERENVQEDVSIESLVRDFDAATEYSDEEEQILSITSPSTGNRRGGGRPSVEDVADDIEKRQYSYIDVKKLGAIISKFKEYRRIDPNIQVHKVIWINKSTNQKTHYAVLDYAIDGHRIAMVAPYESNSSNAGLSYVGEDWRAVFIESPESKMSVREREGVKSCNHRANIKEGRNGIQNMWYHHEQHVDDEIRKFVTA